MRIDRLVAGLEAEKYKSLFPYATSDPNQEIPKDLWSPDPKDNRFIDPSTGLPTILQAIFRANDLTSPSTTIRKHVLNPWYSGGLLKDRIVPLFLPHEIIIPGVSYLQSITSLEIEEGIADHTYPPTLIKKATTTLGAAGVPERSAAGMQAYLRVLLEVPELRIVQINSFIDYNDEPAQQFEYLYSVGSETRIRIR